MSASDHVNPYIKAYHISWDETPPHELKPTNVHRYEEGGNIHPDVLHMGTRDSAMQIYRTHLHEYEIDPSVVHPSVYGDAQNVQEKANTPGTDTHRKVLEKMKGVQPMLTESITGDPREAVRTGMVTPYRNLSEDTGSISYMVPKSAIASGKVRHVGVKDITEERKNARV